MRACRDQEGTEGDHAAANQGGGSAAAQAASGEAPPQRPARKMRGERPSAIIAALGRAHSEMQAQLARLQAERQDLLARREALEQWVAAVEEFATATAPVRAAAAARAQGDAAERLRLQDTALAARLGHSSVLPGVGGDRGRPSTSSSSSGGGGGGGGGATAAAHAALVAHLADPATGEALLRECEAQSVQGFAAMYRGAVQALASHLLQVGGGAAPASAAASARLADEVFSLLSRYTLTMLLSPSAVFGTVALRLDTLQPIEAEPPLSFWAHCVEQARPTARQDRAAAAMLAKWLEATGAALARRAELAEAARHCGVSGDDRADDDAAPEEYLAEIEACNAEFVVATATITVAICGHVFSPEQTAALLVSAYPYIPSFLVLERQFRDRARRASAADAAAAAANPGGGASGGGGEGEGRGPFSASGSGSGSCVAWAPSPPS